MNPKIIIKKEKGEAVAWISQSTLLSFCGGLSDGYLRVVRNYNKIGRIDQWKFQQIDGVYFYRYDAIPDRKPAMYRSQLPTLEELVALSKVKDGDNALLIDLASEYIGENFVKHLVKYNEYNEHQCIALGKACAFIEFAVKYLIEQKIDIRSNAIFQDFGKMVEVLDLKYIPSYYRNLKYKILAVYNGVMTVAEQIDLPRAGNQNSVLHKEDREVQGWIYQLRSSGANYTNSFIIRKIQQECDKVGKPVPSDRWIGEQMESRQMTYLTSQGRFGASGKYGSSTRSSIPQANALFAGDCWEIDGTRINMIPFKSKDKDKKRLDSLYIIAVRDVHSGDIVGMHFDVVEDRWSVSAALRNAVENTGYLPFEIRYDRFPGHNSQEFVQIFEALKYTGVKLTCVHKATGKARLERWFGTMQSIALQESPFYYGEGIRSNRKSAHRSEEYLKRVKQVAKQTGWDFDTASNEAENRINTWLNTPYCQWSRKYAKIEKSPRQMHDDSEKPNVFQVGANMISYLFGLRKTLQVRHNGIIRTEIQKEEFVYQIEDYNVISKYGMVLCCYDIHDLSIVHLYEPSTSPMKKYLGFAKEVTPVQMYGKGEDVGVGMGKLIALTKYFDEMREQELQLQVANGSPFNESILLTPMAVSKRSVEFVETEIVQRELRMEDEGEGLSDDVLIQF